MHLQVSPGLMSGLLLLLCAGCGGGGGGGGSDNPPPRNAAPVARDDSYAIAQNSGTTALDVLADNGQGADSDPDGDPLTVVAAGPSDQGGSVQVGSAGRSVDYAPVTGFVGTERFSYTISDGNGGEASATVTVTVVSAPPDARDDAFSVPQNSSGNVFDVLADNGAGVDSDPEGDPLTIVAVGSPDQGGTATPGADGQNIEYAPATGFAGTETFAYTISDGKGGEASATVIVTVVSAPPDARDDAFTVDQNSSGNVLDVLADNGNGPDSDPEGDPLTVVAVGQPNRGGTAIPSADGQTIEYAPTTGFAGTETFSYTVSDGNGGEAAATVTVTVVSQPPDARNDEFFAARNSAPLTLDVLADNGDGPDSDPDGDSLQVIAVTAPDRGGSAQPSGDGSGVVYTPAAEFVGEESFTYTISDGNDQSDTALVIVTVKDPLCEPEVTLTAPQTNHFQVETSLAVTADACFDPDLLPGSGVRAELDGGMAAGGMESTDYEAPYEVTFDDVEKAEHTVRVVLVDADGVAVPGDATEDEATSVGIGELYVAIGDSITLGTGDDIDTDDTSADGRSASRGYPPVLADLLAADKGYPIVVENEGVGGDTSADGLAILPGILDSHPAASRFLVKFGMNDAGAALSVPSGEGLSPGDPGYPGTYKDNMQQMIDLINGAGKEVVLIKVNIALAPRAGSPPGNYYPDPNTGARSVRIQGYNRVLDELKAIPGNDITIEIPDLYAWSAANYEDQYDDAIHPNGLGYQSVADEIFQVIP